MLHDLILHIADFEMRYEKIKTVAPMLTPIKIVAPMHMVGIVLVGRPCNVKSTDVILTQCNVDYCQCTQELILIFPLLNVYDKLNSHNMHTCCPKLAFVPVLQIILSMAIR